MKSLPETSDEDAVNRPVHYNQSGIECIDAIARHLALKVSAIIALAML